MYDFKPLEVHFRDGKTGVGRAAWINAVWMCRCDDPAPLYGCSYPFAKPPIVTCPSCARTYEVVVGDDSMPLMIRETTPKIESKNPSSTSPRKHRPKRGLHRGDVYSRVWRFRQGTQEKRKLVVRVNLKDNTMDVKSGLFRV
jgi:hypothetical protein